MTALDEAGVRRVHVEQDDALAAVRDAKAVAGSRRSGEERPRASMHSEELHVALEHVEGVYVLFVDVWLGAALAGLVARPRHVEQLVREQQPKSARGLVCDHLTLAGR